MSKNPGRPELLLIVEGNEVYRYCGTEGGNPETELSGNPVFMAVTAVTQDMRIFRHEGGKQFQSVRYDSVALNISFASVRRE
uniref:Uncharacterized protein n=1 Tax=Candidatus Kentrum sp. DK TaxID=2126562 RepID=A0A450RTX9_9GAMM|nr:MAG: hypothetical protein BECKDK2373B_GA0170837_10022 [Candidatus Kentron sp. DK]